MTTGTRKTEVLGVFFVSVFTDRVFAQALAPPNLLGKESTMREQRVRGNLEEADVFRSTALDKIEAGKAG